MLDGIDDIDWAAMQHAYGPADEVPAMLRGLLDVDDRVRAQAEEGLWGAVHHQGDVYDSTLATIPFLREIARTPGHAQVVALDLLASYAGVDPSSLLERGEAVPWPHPSGTYREAASLVADARDEFVGQLGSDDPRVRESASVASLAGPPDARVARALLALFGREEDPRVRTTVQAALGWLSRQGVTALDEWVRQQEQSSYPGVRITALVEAGRGGKAVGTPTLVAAVEAAYVQHGPPDVGRPSRWFTRRPRQRTRRAQDEDRVIARLCESLADPGPLLEELLRSSDWEIALDAVTPAGEHVRTVRGDHVSLVRLVAARVDDAPAEVARALMVAGPLARPALPEIVAAPVDDSILATLVTLRDPHAVPHLRAELRRAQPGRTVGFQVARLGPVGSSLADDVVRALSRGGEATAGLLQAVAQLHIVKAVPVVESLLPDAFAVRALRVLGPPAVHAVPRLRALLDGEPAVAVAAAHALWSVASDRSGLPVVLAELAEPTNGFTYRAAADAAGDLRAREAAPLLLDGLEGDDPHGWPQLASARALWRIGPEAAPVDRVTDALRTCWTINESIRFEVADLLVEMGTSAQALVDLVREEAADPLRLTSRSGGWSTADVERDEELLASLRVILENVSA